MNMRLVKSAEMTEELMGAGREQAVFRLKDALRQLFTLRHAGVAHAEVTRAQGLVDGYMNCLLDLGLTTDRELLELVAASRRGVDGAATASVPVRPMSEADTQVSA